MKKIKETKTPQQIVEAEIATRGPGKDWRAAYLMLVQLTKKPDWRLFRTNDSLFLIHNFRDKEKSVEFYIYNGDSKEELRDNLKEFFTALKVSGFKVAKFKPVGEHTAQTIRSANIKTVDAGDKVQVQL